MDDTEIFAVVKRNVPDVIPDLDPTAVSMDQRLADLGCNSVDRAEIVAMTMEQLGIPAPTTEFSQVSDIGSIVGVLRRHA